ncbi:hypothetical protein OG587_30555 [Streptosporangium sp. NBC_01469]|nr:hypothetical protein [Streptosporangium sp. NBC_01469]
MLPAEIVDGVEKIRVVWAVVGRPFQDVAFVVVDPQRVCKESYGGAARVPGAALLEVADGARADCGEIGELLLGDPRPPSVAQEQGGELDGAHRPPFLRIKEPTFFWLELDRNAIPVLNECRKTMMEYVRGLAQETLRKEMRPTGRYPA